MDLHKVVRDPWSNCTLALVAGGIALQFFKGKARKEEEWCCFKSREPS